MRSSLHSLFWSHHFRVGVFALVILCSWLLLRTGVRNARCDSIIFRELPEVLKYWRENAQLGVVHNLEEATIGSKTTKVDATCLRYHMQDADLIISVLAQEQKVVMIDVGAHLGEHTEKMIHNQNIVYAFEPDPRNHNVLAAALRPANGTQAKIYVIPGIAGVEDGVDVSVMLHPDRDQSGIYRLRTSRMAAKIAASAAATVGHVWVEQQSKSKDDNSTSPSDGDVAGSGWRHTQVLSHRIDRLVKSDVHLLKVDVRGHELPVLRGCEDLINNYEVKWLVLGIVPEMQTQNGYPPTELWAWLQGHNFRCIDISGTGRAPASFSDFLVSLGSRRRRRTTLVCFR